MRSELVGTLLGMAKDSAWQPTMSALAKEFCGHAVCVGTANMSRDEVAIPEHFGLSGDFESKMLSHCNTGNVYFQKIGGMPFRSVFSDVHMDRQAGRGTFKKQRFYQNFLKSLDVDHLASCLVYAKGDKRITISLGRDRRRGPWSKHEISRLSEVAQVLEHSLSVASVINEYRLKEQVTESALKQMRSAVFMVDARRHLVYAKACAEQYIDNQYIVRLDGGKLVGQSPLIDNILKRNLNKLNAMGVDAPPLKISLKQVSR